MRYAARAVVLGMALALTGPDLAAQTEPLATMDAKAQCIAEHEKAQVLRTTSSLKAAREALLFCSQQVCPSAVRGDCLPWLAEVARSIPSIIVRAKLDGVATSKVHVLVDGAEVAAELDGKPIELDPGLHALRFEHPSAPANEQDLLLNAGQLNRLLLVEFTTEGPKRVEVGPPPPSPSPSPAPPAVAQYRPVPALAYVLGGVAVLGAGTSAGFGLLGMDERDELDASCRPGCSSDEVDRVRTKFLVADVSLGVAIVASLGAGYVYFTRPVEHAVEQGSAATRRVPGPSPGRPALGVAVSRAGAVFGVRGEF